MNNTVNTPTVFENTKTIQKRVRLLNCELPSKRVQNEPISKPPNLFLKVKRLKFAHHSPIELIALGIFHLTKWQHTIKNHLKFDIDSICLIKITDGKIAQQQS